MSVTGKLYDPNSGVRRVILTSNPQLHPFSNVDSAPNNYYCLANDMKGFQVEIDLQALPPGVALSQLAPNQVWWVEKRTTLYRIYLYGGTYDPKTRQINSTDPLPGIASALSIVNVPANSDLTPIEYKANNNEFVVADITNGGIVYLPTLSNNGGKIAVRCSDPKSTGNGLLISVLPGSIATINAGPSSIASQITLTIYKDQSIVFNYDTVLNTWDLESEIYKAAPLGQGIEIGDKNSAGVSSGIKINNNRYAVSDVIIGDSISRGDGGTWGKTDWGTVIATEENLLNGLPPAGIGLKLCIGPNDGFQWSNLSQGELPTYAFTNMGPTAGGTTSWHLYATGQTIGDTQPFQRVKIFYQTMASGAGVTFSVVGGSNPQQTFDTNSGAYDSSGSITISGGTPGRITIPTASLIGAPPQIGDAAIVEEITQSPTITNITVSGSNTILTTTQINSYSPTPIHSLAFTGYRFWDSGDLGSVIGTKIQVTQTTPITGSGTAGVYIVGARYYLTDGTNGVTIDNLGYGGSTANSWGIASQYGQPSYGQPSWGWYIWLMMHAAMGTPIRRMYVICGINDAALGGLYTAANYYNNLNNIYTYAKQASPLTEVVFVAEYYGDVISQFPNTVTTSGSNIVYANDIIDFSNNFGVKAPNSLSDTNGYAYPGATFGGKNIPDSTLVTSTCGTNSGTITNTNTISGTGTISSLPSGTGTASSSTDFNLSTHVSGAWLTNQWVGSSAGAFTTTASSGPIVYGRIKGNTDTKLTISQWQGTISPHTPDVVFSIDNVVIGSGTSESASLSDTTNPWTTNYTGYKIYGNNSSGQPTYGYVASGTTNKLYLTNLSWSNDPIPSGNQYTLSAATITFSGASAYVFNGMAVTGPGITGSAIITTINDPNGTINGTYKIVPNGPLSNIVTSSSSGNYNFYGASTLSNNATNSGTTTGIASLGRGGPNNWLSKWVTQVKSVASANNAKFINMYDRFGDISAKGSAKVIVTKDSNVIVLASGNDNFSNIALGMSLQGDGIFPGTTVASLIDLSSNKVTMSSPAYASAPYGETVYWVGDIYGFGQMGPYELTTDIHLGDPNQSWSGRDGQRAMAGFIWSNLQGNTPLQGNAPNNSTWFNYSTSPYFVNTTETKVITSDTISGFTNYLVFFKAIQSLSDGSWHTISARIVPSGAKIVGGATDIYQIGTSISGVPGIYGASYSNSIDFTMPVTVNTTGPIQLGVNLLSAGGTASGNAYNNTMLTIMGVS